MFEISLKWTLTLLISTCQGNYVQIYHAYQKVSLPAEVLPQTWISLNNDTYEPLYCSLMCTQDFNSNRGCNGFSNSNKSSCILYSMNPSLWANNYQGSEITVFPRVEQNPTTGTVGIAIGGIASTYFSTLEAFTIDGHCNFSFTNIPVAEAFPMVEVLSNRIISYTNTSLYQYSFSTASWDPLPSSNFAHKRRAIKVFQNKLYVSDFNNAEVYDPDTMTWSLWSNMPVDGGINSCSAIYKDTMIVVGGYPNGYTMLQHNFSQGAWTNLPNLGSQMTGPACGFVAGNPDIFLAMCEGNGYIFDLKLNTVKAMALPVLTRWSPSFMNFGTRTFLFGGQISSGDTATFEEYIYSSNSWKTSTLSLAVAKRMTSVIYLSRIALGC